MTARGVKIRSILADLLEAIWQHKVNLILQRPSEEATKFSSKESKPYDYSMNLFLSYSRKYFESYKNSKCLPEVFLQIDILRFFKLATALTQHMPK